MARRGAWPRVPTILIFRYRRIGADLSHLDIGTPKHHNRRMRATIALDEDIYEAAQHLWRVSGERLGKVISSLARRGLERRNPSVRKGPRCFPTFEVPAGAPIIPASRIERVLDEEGLF